jgi:hypothetical protein
MFRLALALPLRGIALPSLNMTKGSAAKQTLLNISVQSNFPALFVLQVYLSARRFILKNGYISGDAGK